MRSKTARLERTLGAATRFLDEMRSEMERSVGGGGGIPPRLRSIHERVGHATPEYRTLAIPVPDGVAGASPEILSGLIARFAAEKCPDCLILAMDLTLDSTGGEQPVLVAEARDGTGTRLFWMQPYRVAGEHIVWGEPVEDGWRDPGEEEMILDAAFAVARAAPRPVRRRVADDVRGDARDGTRRSGSGGREGGPLPMAADSGRRGAAQE